MSSRCYLGRGSSAGESTSHPNSQQPLDPESASPHGAEGRSFVLALGCVAVGRIPRSVCGTKAPTVHEMLTTGDGSS